MSSFADLLGSRLANLRTVPDGWQAACPICQLEGHDRQGVHLKVWRHSHAFNCSKYGSDSGHNRQIRAFLYEGITDGAILASLDVQIADPEPKLEADTVYPESMLTRLVPDHSYWIGRGISEDVLRRLEGGRVPSSPPSKLSGYYTFPVREEGRIIGWWSRLVDEASFGPKHKHLVRTSRAVYPYAIAAPEIKRTGRVLLTEGGADALTWATFGMWNWFILFGLNLNSRILGKLVALNPAEVVISTNNDALTINPQTGKPKDEGNTAALKVRDRLVPYLGEGRVRIRLPQTRKDWNAAHTDGTGELLDFKRELEQNTRPAFESQ